jgi:hypothetical protein
MASRSKNKLGKIRIDLAKSVDLMTVDAATRAVVLLSRFAVRRAQRIAKEIQDAAAGAPIAVKSNGYRRRNRKK